MADDKPDYKVYRSRKRLSRKPEGGVREGIDDLRSERPRPDAAPEYTVHRSGGRRRVRGPRGPRLGRPRFTYWRVLGYVLGAALLWVTFSGLIFLVSAQIQRDEIAEEAGGALDASGYTLTSPNTVLVLGSDARTKSTSEPGSRVGGPSRSDAILLMRVGGGKSGRLSIPRDTVVDIPGHGRDRINAAFAIGGPQLAIQTVKQHLGIEINHLVEVDFANFPELIDALGGIDVRTGCVISKINGGYKNGGITLRLRPGSHHLDGKRALALARTRKNSCRRNENDLTRARRQQKVLAAIKSRATSPYAFIRLPWVAWAAPKAIRSDMAGPSLLGLFGAAATTGTPKTRVLGRVQPDGTVGSTPEERRREVQRFLAG
jgi:LCP family protein required for cell wall assembly